MKRQFYLLGLIILTAIICSCHSGNSSNGQSVETNSNNEQSSSTNLINAQSSSSLVGTYSIKEQGQLKEFIKIEQHGSEFTLSEKQSGNWRTPKVVTPVGQSDLEKMLKKSVNVTFVGLGNKNVALFKMPVGWSSGKFQCNTGYWLASMLGPIELYKK